MVKVALFTSFGPDGGGGAVNLRSWLDHLPDLDVTWFHLGPPARLWPNCVSLGPPLVGGQLAGDLVRTPAMWLGLLGGAIDRIAERVLAHRADRHWVVAMDEGVPLGTRLLQRASAVPLHVSIQDDQEHGMYGRSRRYRMLARLTRAPVRRLLRAARSVDVTSTEMADYYRTQLGLRSTVLHPIVAGPAPTPGALAVTRDPRRLTMGHIGSVYSGGELETMIEGLKRAAAVAGREPAAVFIGLLPRYHALVARAGIAVELPSHLEERDAVPALARCDFVYAMYPFDRASDVFRRTSLPTKLTTYVQTGRPILAHAPAESTLARIVGRFAVGAACERNDPGALAQGIASLLAQSIAPARFGTLRETFYAIDNAHKLSALLRYGDVTP